MPFPASAADISEDVRAAPRPVSVRPRLRRQGLRRAGGAPGRRTVRALGALAAALPLLWPAAAPAAAPYALAGRVVQVADGDTLTLLVGRQRQRVRLASIDAPETGHGRTQPGQPYGQAARRALADLVAGKTLRLRCYEQDHYGREICDVPLPDGRLANRLMVASGMAWANRQGGGKYLRDASLAGLERQARQQGVGLWRDAHPVAPWDWRWKCWRALETGHPAPIC
ncbi:MAG TPA: thermonuclease family protein [Castellaniella sp.]|nr:thermonuclease family protein [Castellaniella sp.]